ncbi:DUF6078 family protein [Prevotella sp. F0091]|uniref:DUF6078 family protein n=1 Tax=Prevotella sp. F0091 TaxID=1227276 RepID=UPI0025FBBADF|nr:DUF6078 family protein [Prevotella sp. F0091]
MKFQETTTEMENKNKYQDAPKHYLLCYNTACKKAKTCLRQIVACENINKEKIVQCVNPSVNGGENCDYYKADRIVRIAYGMEHTFDKVLATDIARIRGTLVRHFGNGSYYVRRNGKKGITPAEQEYINSIFIAYGYAEGACFDNYKDEREW